MKLKFNLKKRELLLVIFIGALFFIMLMDRVVFVGLGSKFKGLARQTKYEEAMIKMGVSTKYKKDDIVKEYKKYAPYLNIEGSEKEVMTKFLKEIENITQESDGSIISLTPKPEVESQKGYKKYKADLQMEAGTEEMFNFFNKIQENKLLIKIDSFIVAPKTEDAQLLKLDAAVSMVMTEIHQ